MCQTQSRYFCKRHETSIRGRHAIDDEQRSEEIQKRSCVRIRTKPVFWQIATVEPRTIPMGRLAACFGFDLVGTVRQPQCTTAHDTTKEQNSSEP